jgi:hypothetical protein
MSEHPSARPDLMPVSAVLRISEAQRAWVELGLLTRLAGRGADGLASRRAELLRQVRQAPRVKRRSRLIDSRVTELAPFIEPWAEVRLPCFAEGVNETPPLGRTGYEIDTLALLPGGVEFCVDPEDDGTVDPNLPKWWTRTWTCSCLFPAAPVDGWIYYRFTTDTTWGIIDAAARSGVVAAFICVGTTCDASTGSPLDPGAFSPVGYPFVFSLPGPERPVDIDVSTPVSGSIYVQAGKSAAIGIVYGIVAGLADGAVVSVGSMMTRLTLRSVVNYIGDPYDLIEYRFEPDWWVTAIGQRLQYAVGS